MLEMSFQNTYLEHSEFYQRDSPITLPVLVFSIPDIVGMFLFIILTPEIAKIETVFGGYWFRRGDLVYLFGTVDRTSFNQTLFLNLRLFSIQRTLLSEVVMDQY